MRDKSCYTCHYHSIVDGKLACTYNGICHSPQGEKTAYQAIGTMSDKLKAAISGVKLGLNTNSLKMCNNLGDARNLASYRRSPRHDG